MVTEHAPLEDELGDVLEKALRCAGLTEAALAERTGIDRERIADAIGYQYDEWTPQECRVLAAALSLNEVGVQALAAGKYPLPQITGLPFCLYPLRMTHGVGVTNAYIVADCRQNHGVLFDTGNDPDALQRLWPAAITRLDAVFITHAEREHLGGLPEVRRRFGAVPVFAPVESGVPGATEIGEGSRLVFGAAEVELLATPGHAEAHHCYIVRAPRACKGVPLLLSGDLLFAGSVGVAYFCAKRLNTRLARVLAALPPETVVAPGHGPLTTIGNERACNPFVI
jgi:glyoxylase-like metal-dependent hydrolase (beta-lactamase superfamily II)